VDTAWRELELALDRGDLVVLFERITGKAGSD
jgi:hypothetical protein